MTELPPLPAFAFATAGRIVFGRGTALDAPERIAALGTEVFLVHGRSAERAAWLVDALFASGVQVTAFSCPAEPTLELLDKAVAAARKAGATVVVGLGGGAAMDLGKAVAALVPAEGEPLDYLEVVGKGLALPAAPLPFVALPTTSGTGAEVTKNAVIGVPRHRRKVSLRDDRMLADLAVGDPALTDGLPKAVTLASGLDAIVQNIEPYVSARANPLTDALCRQAIPLGLGALQRLMEGEDRAARDAMAWVSLSGGLALANSGLGAVHGLAGVIGGRCGAPHGAVCGALLPAVLAANLEATEANPPAHARLLEVRGMIARAFGTGGDEALAALEGWMGEAGLPRLSALGVPEEDHGEIARASAASSSMKANPVALDEAALVAVLRRAA